MITFEEFYDNNYHEARRIVAYKLGGVNNVYLEDIVHDIFVKASKYFDNGTYDGKKQTQWLRFIIQSVLIDHWRSLKRKSTVSYDKENPEEFTAIDFAEDGELNSHEVIEKSDSLGILRLMLNSIPTEQKEVIERFYRGESYKDMSEDLGKSINTVLSIKRYGIINLQKLVKKHNISVTI